MPDTEIKHYQCRHIFTDGHRCGSKCLRNQDFCYYHYGARQAKPLPDLYRDTQSSFDLPAPEDRSAIQAGIGLILQRIANGCLDSKRAGLLLYGLQIASLNLPKAPATPEEPVEEITIDEQNQTLAPIHEIIPPPRKKTLEEIVMEQWYMEASAEPDEPAQGHPSTDTAPRPTPSRLLSGGPAASSRAPRRRNATSAPGRTFHQTTNRPKPTSSIGLTIPTIQAVATKVIPRRRKAHP